MNKKILISVLLLVVLLTLGWFFFIRTSTSPLAETINDILPFGSGEDAGPGTGNGDPEGGEDPTDTDTNTAPTARLFKITDTPTAGAIAFERNNELFIRYVERSTGHIFDVSPATLTKIQITNNTLPKIYEALFKKDGGGVVIRSIQSGTDMITNTSLTLTAPKSTSTEDLYTVQATALRGNLGDMGVSSAGSLAYVQHDTGVVAISGFAGEKPQTLFTSAFTNWVLDWAGTNVLLTTKAGADASGYSYLINTGTGAMRKLLGPLDALTTLPNVNGTRALYSYTNRTKPVLSALNIANGNSTNVIPATYPEKCVWSARSTSVVYCGVPLGGLPVDGPERWYQGITHFSDRIWRFDVDTDFTDLIAEPEKSQGVKIDATNLSLSPDEDYLIFTNRTDLTLWALKLE